MNFRKIFPRPKFSLLREENAVINNVRIRGVLSGRRIGVKTLNETAFRILSLCDGLRSIEDVVNTLASEYEVDIQRLRSDVVEFLEDARRRGLIEYSEKPEHVEVKSLPLTESIETVGFLRAPVMVSIEVTTRCNLKCIHCSVWKNIPQQDELRLNHIEKIARECADLGVYMIGITGGEPFIRQDLLEILKIILDYDLNISLATNGTIIDERIISFLERNRDSILVQVSLDGSKPKVHDRIRGVKGAFKKTIKTIKKLREKEIPLVVKTVIQRGNIHDLVNIYHLLRKLKVRGWDIARYVPTGANLEHIKDCWVWFKEFLDSLMKLKLEYDRSGREIDIQVAQASLESVVEYYEQLISDRKLGMKIRWCTPTITCAAGVSYLYIRANGDILPCDYFPPVEEYVCGNVKYDNLRDVWFNSEKLHKVRCLRREELMEPCRSCQKPCASLCLASGIVFFKKLGSPNILCPLVEQYHMPALAREICSNSM